MKNKILLLFFLMFFILSSFVFAFEVNTDRGIYADYYANVLKDTDYVTDLRDWIDLNDDYYVVVYSNDTTYFVVGDTPDDVLKYNNNIRVYDDSNNEFIYYSALKSDNLLNTRQKTYSQENGLYYFELAVGSSNIVSTNNSEIYDYLIANFDSSSIGAFEGALPDEVLEPSYNAKKYFYDLYHDDFEIWEVSSYFTDTSNVKHTKRGLVATNNMSGNATTLYRDSQSVSHFLACDDSQISYYYNYIWYANATDMSNGYPTQWTPDTDNDFNQPTSVWFEYNDVRVESVLDDNNSKTFKVTGYIDNTVVDYDITSNYSITNIIDNNVVGTDGTNINLSFDIDLGTSSNSDVYFKFNSNQIRLNFTDVMGNSGQSTNGTYDNNVYGNGITGTIEYFKDIIISFLVAVVDIFTALINQIKSFAFVLSYAFESFPPVILSIIIFGFAMSVFKMVRG